MGVLESYVRKGGMLLVAGQSASLDTQGHKRQRPGFFGSKLGKGEGVYLEQMPPLDQLAENFRSHEKSKVPGIEAPTGVVYNVVGQPASHRVVVHLLNYGSAPASHIKIDLKQKYRSATLMSPDASRVLPLKIIQPSSASAEVSVPSLKIYSMLVLNE